MKKSKITDTDFEFILVFAILFLKSKAPIFMGTIVFLQKIGHLKIKQ